MFLSNPIMYSGNLSLDAAFTNSEDPDEMQHDAAFHQGLNCLLRWNQSHIQNYIIIRKIIPVTP